MRRWLAAVGLLLLMVGSGGDVFGQHLCPHHDGPIAALSEAGKARDGHAAHAHASAGHAHGSAGHAHGDAEPVNGDAAHGCTCLGECVGAPAIVLPEAAVAALRAGAGEAVWTAPSHESLLPRERPAYLLPWSHAPPTLV